MRFSIRELLILAVLCALGMLAWNRNQEATRQALQTSKTLAQLETTRKILFADQPDAYAAKMRERDGYAAISKLRKRGEEHFQTIQDKYGSIVPRGDGILSIRAVPMLRSDNMDTPIALRIHVPENRRVWLKYGVHPTKRNVNSARQNDTLDDLATKSPFENSGPYEMRLQPGEHMIYVTLMQVANAKLPFRFKLDDQILIDSAFHSEEVDGHSRMSVSAMSQIDFKKERRLPTLMTINMSLESDSKAKLSWGFSIWVSNRSSDFEEFPK